MNRPITTLLSALLILVAALPESATAASFPLWQRAHRLARIGEQKKAIPLLEKLLKRRALSKSLRRHGRILLARLYLRQRRPKAALALLKGIRTRDSALRLFVRYYRALAAVASDRTRLARKQLQRVVRAGKRFIYWRNAQLQLGLLLEKRGDRKRALATYRNLLQRVSDRWIDKPMVIGRLLRLTGDAALRKRLVIRFGHTPAGRKAARKLNPIRLSVAERIERIRNLMRRWDYRQAAAELRPLLRNRTVGMQAHYLLAVVYQDKLRTKIPEAVRLLRIVQKKGSPKYRQRALYKIAKAFGKLENYADALKTWREYIKQYPRGRYIELAYYYLGWLHHDRHRDKQAISGFNEYLAKSPVKKRRLTYILWFKGWSQYRLKRYRVAIKTFSELLRYRNTLIGGKGLYWIGRCREKLGQKKRAIAVYRRLLRTYSLSYYPSLADRRLLALTGKSELSWVRRRPVWPRKRPHAGWPLKTLQSKKLRRRLGTVYSLWAITEIDAARLGYSKLASKVEQQLGRPATIWDFFALSASLERYNQLWKWIGRRHGFYLRGYPRGAKVPLYAMAYPRAYRTYVRYRAAQQKIKEYVVYSIMRQESRYRVSAISHTDAMGLMQVIPKTARKIARTLGLTYSRYTFFTPPVNIRYAVFYLGQLIRKFRGQLVFAFAGYNAGAHAMARFLDQHKGLPFDEMVEEIPYNEARNYCRKVAEHYVRYLYLYEPVSRRNKQLEMLFPRKVRYDYLNNINY